MVEGNQLKNATTMASLAILLSRAGATQMPKVLGLEVSIVATTVMAIKAMVMNMVIVRPMVRPMP